jgi:CHAT domain-containing protein/tetratricopeptide (TPR) repeat protein
MSLATLLLGLALSPGLLRAAAEQPVHLREAFDTNSLRAYRTVGPVQWRKGQVTLPPGAVLVRPLEVGHNITVRALLSLGDAREPRAVLITLAAGDKAPRAAVRIALRAGKVRLENLTGSRESIELGPVADAQPWEVRVQLRHGVLAARAWKQGTAEPKVWHTLRDSGNLRWVPRLLVFTAQEQGGALGPWSLVADPPPRPLSAAEQRLQAEAEKLGNEYLSLRRTNPREAADRARRMLALRAKVQGPRHLLTGAALNDLGTALSDIGQHAEAQQRYEQALAVFVEVLGEDHPFTANALANLGRHLLEQRQPAAARPYLERALAVDRRLLGAEHSTTVFSMFRLGQVLALTADPVTVRPFFEELLAVSRKVRGPEHPATLVVARTLAELLTRLGEHQAARARHEEALAILRKIRGPEHRETVEVLLRLGRLLMTMEEYPAARACYEESVAARRKIHGPKHVAVGQALGFLGIVEAALKDYSAARRHLEEALAIWRQASGDLDPNTSAALHNLASVLLPLGEADTARRLLEEALEIRKKTLGPRHPDTANALNTLGSMLFGQRQFLEARGYLEEARSIFREARQRGTFDSGAIPNLFTLGGVLEVLKEPEAARACYQEALDFCRKQLGDVPTTARTQRALGLALARRGKTQEAWEHLVQSTAAEARANHRFLAGNAERDYTRQQRYSREGLEALLGLAAAHPNLAETRSQDLAAALFDWTSSVSQALHARQEALILADTPAAREQHQRLVLVRRQLAQLVLQGPGRDPAAFRRQREDLERLRDELERKLARSVDAFRVLQRRQQAGPAEVAGQLPRGAVLLSLIRYDQHYLGQAVKDAARDRAAYAALLLGRPAVGQPTPTVRFVSLGPAGPLDAAIRAWRTAAQQGPIEPVTEQKLRELVWDPVARALPPKTSRLFVIPDGQLAVVPLEALRLGDGKYLVERYEVSYLATGRELAFAAPLGERNPPGEAALVLANPDYDAGGEGTGRGGGAGPKGLRRLLPLPGFAAEAAAVVKAWGAQRAGEKVALLQGAAASEEGLTKVRRPRLLYLITHGFFLADTERAPAGKPFRDLDLVPVDPSGPRLPAVAADPRLRSGLALAGANQWQRRPKKGLSDGLLTALEVENLDLWGTELVVLSACETGLGEVQVGEGVLGLRRAFQLAGARTVVASLWKVPDAETERLMAAFLGRWLQGEPPPNALRQAQLELIRRLRTETSATRRQAQPLYWAGFICHGSPR